MIPQNPTFIPRPFAAEGVAATIPDDKTVFGEASWREGFPTETGLPLNAGGIPPRKADFNGTLKALSEHTFFGQSGCVYPWDATLNYLANSHVVGSDGKEYAAKVASGPDDAAGAQDPTLDTDGTYWADVSAVIGTGGETPASGGIYNTRTVLTTSGTYTAPVSGWYKVTAIGGGGGGGGSQVVSTSNQGGLGGASGGYGTVYMYFSKDTAIDYVIGAGGTGNAAGSISPTSGGDTTFNGLVASGANQTKGGLCTYQGEVIGAGFASAYGQRIVQSAGGAPGCGFGGGAPGLNATFYGGGGGGGTAPSSGSATKGGNGYQGCVILEYYDPSKTA